MPINYIFFKITISELRFIFSPEKLLRNKKMEIRKKIDLFIKDKQSREMKLKEIILESSIREESLLFFYQSSDSKSLIDTLIHGILTILIFIAGTVFGAFSTASSKVVDIMGNSIKSTVMAKAYIDIIKDFIVDICDSSSYLMLFIVALIGIPYIFLACVKDYHRIVLELYKYQRKYSEYLLDISKNPAN